MYNGLMLYNREIILWLVFFFIGIGKLRSQDGSAFIYNFLNLNPSPNLSALGGLNITNTSSISNALVNPALITSQDSGAIAVSHAFYQTDIQLTSFNYLLPLKHPVKVHVGVVRSDYGVVEGLNEFGMPIGSVNSNDNAITLGVGKIFEDKLSIGLNLKFIQSKIGFDQSLGIATDVGFLYHKKIERFKLGILFRNIGTQITTYGEMDKRERLPFEVIVGISKRLKYVPVRFSLNYRYLNRWNIISVGYVGDNRGSLFGDEDIVGNPIIDNFFRHLSFGTEVMVGQREQLQLRLGYNHKIRRELGVSDYFSLSGFSFGFSVKLKKLVLDFSRSIYHLAGGTNQIGLKANIKELLRGGSR